MSAAPARVSTGVSGLDEVVGGGVLRGALVFLVGAPGVGKTVLAEQMAFHAAAGGGTVLYFTTLSEPHTKLISNVRAFAFFDEALIGERIQFLNLEQTLRQGPPETADAIVEMARDQRAALVVLDGFRSVADFADQPVRVREFLYRLAARLAVVGAVCLVTFEGDPFDTALYPELATADVILGMWHEARQVSRSRHLAVLKARGSAPLPGAHSFVIAPDGVRCFPLPESLPAPRAAAPGDGRAAFDIPGLDALLDGGLTAASSTVLAGSLGSGKTTLALAWLLAGARRREAGLYFGFYESEQQLVERAAVFGYNLTSALQDRSVTVRVRTPIGLDGNQLAAEIRGAVEARRIRRLVIDTGRELERSVAPERAESYLTALMAYLRGAGVTALVAKDTGTAVGEELDFAGSPDAALAENVILLRRLEGGSARRIVQVLKMRFSNFDAAPHELRLESGGISVGPPSDVRAAGVVATAGHAGTD
ncbi:MAG TPA: ATPase domain-containing protein [Dehalococcoidia bacterium]|nr:ATPase domain-containing protein [Dehalococcoidia bacterium]